MAGSARVFVSYRRQDTRHVAGRLADRLVERFQVFMDMDTIEPGSDFADVIQKAVDDCDVFLPVIGPDWAGVDRETGRRRLDDPADWVGAETVAALERGIPVIPVLVDGAVMPAPAELPEALAPLARRQAMSIRHESFSADVSRLIEAIERRLTPAAPSDPHAAGSPHRQSAEPERVEAAYMAALAAFFAHRWPEAVKGLEEVLELDPQHPSAPGRLAEARRNAQLSTWSAQADKAASEGRWADAVVQLENVRSLDPNYPDLNRRLQVASTKRRIGDVQRDIHSLAAAGQWSAVVAAGQDLAALDPAHADPDGLVSRARAMLAEAALIARYDQGLAELDRGSAASALAHFEAVMRDQPGFQDVQALYAEARRRHLAELYTRAQQDEAAGRTGEAVVALQRINELDPANQEVAQRLRALSGRADPPRSQPTPPQHPPPAIPVGLAGQPAPPPRRRRTGLIAALAALLLAAVVIAAVLLLRDRPGTGTATDSPSDATTASPSPSPSATPSDTPSATVSPSSGSEKVMRHVPSAIADNCKDYTPPAGDALEVDLVAAVRCELIAKDSPKTVWYLRYRDISAMNTAFKAYLSGDFTNGDCLKARQKSTYTVEIDGKRVDAGVLHCYDAEGATYFAWTHDALRMVTFAEDKDLSYKKMKDWWVGAGPIR